MPPDAGISAEVEALKKKLAQAQKDRADANKKLAIALRAQKAAPSSPTPPTTFAALHRNILEASEGIKGILEWNNLEDFLSQLRLDLKERGKEYFGDVKNFRKRLN